MRDTKFQPIHNQIQEIMDKCKNDSAYSVDDMEKDVIALSSIIMRENAPALDVLISELREMTFPAALDKRHELYQAIVEAYEKHNKPIGFTLFDIYIVFPKLVNYGSAMERVVLGKDDSHLMTINDFVKLDDWAGSFNSNKWRGYVFVTDKIDITIAFPVVEHFILKGRAKLQNPAAYIKGTGR